MNRFTGTYSAHLKADGSIRFPKPIAHYMFKQNPNLRTIFIGRSPNRNMPALSQPFELAAWCSNKDYLLEKRAFEKDGCDAFDHLGEVFEIGIYDDGSVKLPKSFLDFAGASKRREVLFRIVDEHVELITKEADIELEAQIRKWMAEQGIEDILEILERPESFKPARQYSHPGP